MAKSLQCSISHTYNSCVLLIISEFLTCSCSISNLRLSKTFFWLPTGRRWHGLTSGTVGHKDTQHHFRFYKPIWEYKERKKYDFDFCSVKSSPYVPLRLMLSARVCLYSAFPTGLSLEDVREYEKNMQEKTNSKVKSTQIDAGEVAAPDLHCTEMPQRIGGEIGQLHGRAAERERERRRWRQRQQWGVDKKSSSIFVPH